MILSLETSTSVCSVAIHRVESQQLLYAATLATERAHSTALTQLVENAFYVMGIDANQLQAVAIAEGPGSYTGLRIGTSVAKGICFAADVPLIAISTLKVMALQVVGKQVMKQENALFCPMIDARRMEVYAALFNNQLEELEEVKSVVVDENSFASNLSEHALYFFGDGAAKCMETIQHENAVFVNDIFPNAVEVGQLALTKFANQQFEDAAYFEPFYLKSVQAKKSTKDKLKL